MTPSARVQAAIEILDLVIAAAQVSGAPADRIVSEWFRTRRFAGSGDRRAVRELVYTAVRTCGERPKHGRAAMLLMAKSDPALAELFDGSVHGPVPRQPGEPVAHAGTAPRWLEQALAASGIDKDQAQSLLGRAPLDVRVNALKAQRDNLDLPVQGEALIARHGLRLPAGTTVEQWPAWKDGLIEVQDGGSQLCCEAVVAAPGETVIDLCAGAGGKSLALAAAMDNRGSILACDTDKRRLSQLPPRAERAGATIIETLLMNPGKEAEMLSDWQGRADAVLIDAPCSGTGTWRRNPEARWRLTPAQLERTIALQSRLLDLGASLVRPGGRLIYVVCSLLDGEGKDQFESFLMRNSGWRCDGISFAAGELHGAGLRLTPKNDATDGFFVARARRL